MGAHSQPESHVESSESALSGINDAVRKRAVVSHTPFARQPSKHGMDENEEMEATISALPSWQDQLSLRGYIVGEALRLAPALSPTEPIFCKRKRVHCIVDS